MAVWVLRLLIIASLPALTACHLSGRPAAHGAARADDGRIAFAAAAAKGATTDLFVISAAGGPPTQVTDTPAPELFPSWSPDATQLAFSYAAETDGGWPIFQVNTMAVDGSERLHVTQAITNWNEFHPSWSHDGTQIAYWTIALNSIWLVDAAGATAPVALVASPDPFGSAAEAAGVGVYDLQEPAWSPDGRRLAFCGADATSRGIFVVNADGTGLTRLTAQVGDCEPAWSPDGTQLAFTRLNPAYLGRAGVPLRDIYIMAADGSAVRQVTTTPADDTSPSWSPDGTRIAYASAGDAAVLPTAEPPRDLPSGYPMAPAAGSLVADAPNDIYVITVDGAEVVNLTRSPGDERDPAWQPKAAGRERTEQTP